MTLDSGNCVNIIKDKHLIVFSDDWGRHPFSCQHIMQHFLSDNKILWVNTIGMRRPHLTMKDLRRSIQKLRSFAATPVNENLPDNLTIINPLMLPFGSRLVRAFNRHSVVSAVKGKMLELRITSPIILMTVPNANDYLGAFNEILAVYYCVDEFSEWPGVEKNLVREMEANLLAQVDFVVAVSDQLVTNKTTPNRPTHLLTHGVDIKHFRHTSCPGICTSNPLLKINQPIVGYFGLIDERVDQDLIEAILKRHPEWSIVFIGKAAVEFVRLSRYQNFYHSDAVSYQNLPCYAALFSVCLLPYVRTKLTDNINPLKLKEYLATGKPVVATALPEAVKLAGWGLRIGNDFEAIVQQIESVLSQDSWNHMLQLTHLEFETWEHKAENLSAWIEEALEEKTAHSA